MANKKKEVDSEKVRQLITEINKHIFDSDAADGPERDLMVSDLKFVYDEEGQWDKRTKTQRAGRPCYTFNRVQQSVNQVLGEQRQNSVSIKIRAVDDKSDPALAQVQAGMIRNIESSSNADSIYKDAFKYAVAGGFGAWRVLPEHRNDFSFDQEIFIKPIYNPLTVYFDPLSLDPIKRDQSKCVIAERISKDLYKSLYDSVPIDIMTSDRDDRGWINSEGVRIAEYFKKVPVRKEIALMSDGRVVPYDSELKKIEKELLNIEGAPTVKRTRTVETFNIEWYKVDGSNILEGPIVYDWKYIPVVKLPGRYVNIEGRQKTQSLIRPARDAQKMYNYNRTTESEMVGNALRAPYMVTAEQIKGYEKQWNEAGSANRPYIVYNSDPKGGGMPQRSAQAEVPAALIGMSQQDAEDIKAATGFHDASLGMRGNEVSGEAIKSRLRSADLGSFEFFDNLKTAIQFTGEIILDQMPSVYDTERVVRILGLDGQEDFQLINAYDEASDSSLDMSQGRYDVTVDLGPTFATQRSESFSNLLSAASVMPLIGDIASDLIMKNSDAKDSDEIVKRLRKSLVARGVAEPTEEEAEQIAAQGSPPPDPVQEALVADAMSKAELNQARVIQTQADTMETMVDTEIKKTKAPIQIKQEKVDLVNSTFPDRRDR